MDQVKIGRFLQELRKEQKLTQEQLAEKLNVARRTVSRWETGSNMPDLDILIELSDLYSVDLRELLNGEKKSEKMDKGLLPGYQPITFETHVKMLSRHKRCLLLFSLLSYFRFRKMCQALLTNS